MSRLFKVNRLYMSGKGKNKFFEGDIVKDIQIENIDEKLKDGSIIPFEKDGDNPANKVELPVKVENETVETVESDVVEGEPLFTFEKDGETIGVYFDTDVNTNGLTKAVISTELMSRGVAFDPSDKKADLYSVLLESFK